MSLNICLKLFFKTKFSFSPSSVVIFIAPIGAISCASPPSCSCSSTGVPWAFSCLFVYCSVRLYCLKISICFAASLARLLLFLSLEIAVSIGIFFLLFLFLLFLLIILWIRIFRWFLLPNPQPPFCLYFFSPQKFRNISPSGTLKVLLNSIALYTSS